MSTAVFVYGTLQPGQRRWPVLVPFTVRADAHSSATARGRLFDPGYGWPVAVFNVGSDDRVPGVVVRLKPDAIHDALEALDAVEGVAGGLFRRILIDVDGRPCWAYHWPGPTDDFRRVESWPPSVE